VELGFQYGEAEHAMYTRGIGNRRLIVSVYVVDLIITGGKNSKLQMHDKFQMADLGKLHFNLGLEVNQTSSGTTVSQGAYALKILMAVALARCNPSHSPMEQRLKLSKSSTTPIVDPTEYRRIVGALHYLVNTRPDLAYAVGYVSWFMEKPTIKHLLAVKRVLRYVAGTIHQGCFYKRKGEKLKLIGYNNSDLPETSTLARAPLEFPSFSVTMWCRGSHRSREWWR
jgi:hypothetical protein